jgi:mono/diheme cytochrome c family protein
MAVPVLLATAGGAMASGQKLGEPAPERSGAEVYSSTCSYCHGHNVGPVLLGRHLPAEAIKAIARTGQNAMPAFRPTEVSRAELDAVAKWIEAAPADPKEHGK